MLLKFASHGTSLVHAPSPPPSNTARWDANKNHFSFPAEQPWTKKRAAPCLSPCYTLTQSSSAEVLHGKHTLKSQVIDRVITLALQGQCKCWDGAFSWTWNQSCSPRECNRKGSAKGKEYSDFPTKMWWKRIELRWKEGSKSNLYESSHIPPARNLCPIDILPPPPPDPTDISQCFTLLLLRYWSHY